MSPRNQGGLGDPHFNEEALLEYVEGTAPDSLALEIEEHFAACDDCLRIARRLGRADAIVSGWNATRHAYVMEAVAVEAGLRAAERRAAERDDANERLRARLERWRTQFQSRARAAARVAVRASREATLSVTRELQSLLVPGGWELIPAAKGRSEEVKVLEVRGTAESRLAVTEELLADGTRATVLTLTVPRSLAGSEPLLVMLVDVASPENFALGEATAVGDVMKVEFRQLLPGEYIAVVEPGGEAV